MSFIEVNRYNGAFQLARSSILKALSVLKTVIFIDSTYLGVFRMFSTMT